MNEKVTISKSLYEMLLANTKRMNFLECYRPSIGKDSEEKGVELVVEENGIIDTLRYGSVAECIDGAINDMRELQTVFWVGEKTEIYAARSLEELVISGFFSKDEMKGIKCEESWGVIDDLNIEMNILDEETGKKEKKT
ncbi:TPA: hypothetical protein QB618_002113, partial [Pasteurella multocida]|nr:hypothetical protein [Pasteurella multocida]